VVNLAANHLLKGNGTRESIACMIDRYPDMEQKGYTKARTTMCSSTSIINIRGDLPTIAKAVICSG
jgi:CMP-2-keto-3-deoxyoctulosonic acid synthetase